MGQNPPLDSDVVVQDPLVLEGPNIAGQLGVLPLLRVLEVGFVVSVSVYIFCNMHPGID